MSVLQQEYWVCPLVLKKNKKTKPKYVFLHNNTQFIYLSAKYKTSTRKIAKRFNTDNSTNPAGVFQQSKVKIKKKVSHQHPHLGVPAGDHVGGQLHNLAAF